MAEYHNCPNCGQPVGPQDRFCSNCGQPLELRAPEEPSPPPPPSESPESSSAAPVPPVPPAQTLGEEPKYVPWEDRQRVGFFKALWETWKESTFYPNRFFAKAPFSGGLWDPLFYAIIIAWVGYAINQIIGWMFSSMTIGFLANFLHNEEILDRLGLFGGLGFLHVILFLLILPFMVVISAFIGSGIYHLLLMIFGWNKRDYEATFRALTYAAAPLAFLIVPACGSPIAYVWSLVLTIIGIKHFQRTTNGQASLVVLLPLLLCCCFFSFLAIIFGAAIVAFIQNMMNGGYYFE